MAIEVPQNKEISGGKNVRRKEVSSTIRRRGANRGGAYTLRNDSEEELLREMLRPSSSEQLL